MTDWAQEIFRKTPTKEELQPVDWVQEIFKKTPVPGEVSLEPPVGGTYQPTGEISTITNKPIEKYLVPSEPEATWGAQMKASFADTPAGKIQAFAGARGIPDSEILGRYRVGKTGRIEFKDAQGKWQREVGAALESKVKNIAAETLAHPGTYLGTAGAMVGGPLGAGAGAIVGEAARKAVGKLAYGEKIKPAADLLDLTLNGLFALGGESVSKLVGWGINRFIGRKAGMLTHAGEEIKRGLLSPVDHAKAGYIQALAQMHGMELAPHQLYDKEGMTNLWKYLRKHPLTSDAIGTFERDLERSGTDAVEGLIEKMGGYVKTPSQLGMEVKTTATGIIDKAEAIRTKRVSPLYEKAAQEAQAAGGVEIQPVIDRLDKIIESYPEGPSKKALLRVKKSLGEDIPERDLRKIQKAMFDLNDMIEGTSVEAAQIAPSSKKILNRDLSEIKDTLLGAMKQAAPTFEKANLRYEKLSGPIDRLKSNIIGEISRLKSDKQIAGVSKRLLSPQNMPDEALLLEAKQVLQRENPELWKNLIGDYMRDAFESMKATQGTGKVVNPLGKMHQALFGNEKQRRLLWAAMEPREFKSFSDLMTVLQRAAIGTGSESMTAPFQAIEKQLSGEMGGRVAQFIQHPKTSALDWTVGKWNDIILSRRQGALLDALTAPEVVKKLAELKRLSPRSQKFMDGFAVLTSSIAKRTLEERP